MSSSLSVFARASTSDGKWGGGSVIVHISTPSYVDDLKKQIANEMNLVSSDILSLHPVHFADLDADAPPSPLSSKLPVNARLSHSVVTSHTASSDGDTQLFLIALLLPMEGAWRERGWSSGEAYHPALTLPPPHVVSPAGARARTGAYRWVGG